MINKKSKPNNILLKLKYDFGSIIGQYPSLYKSWCQLFRPDALKRFVSAQTDIVIEGFPRSGNTFAVAAFIISQTKVPNIARHTHKVMQIKKAAELNIPTIVLIRQPEDAVISLTIRHPYISLKQGLKTYVKFYSGVRPYKAKYILAKFEDVTSDYGQIIQQVNQKFQTNFQLFNHNTEQKELAFQFVEQMHREHTGDTNIDENAVARPSNVRNNLKKELLHDLGRNDLRRFREKALAVYQDIVSN